MKKETNHDRDVIKAAFLENPELLKEFIDRYAAPFDPSSQEMCNFNGGKNALIVSLIKDIYD